MLAPALPALQDHDGDRQNSHSQRYYDKQHKDWHEWNDNENQTYQRYVQENHRQARDFNRLSKRDQQNYFKWSHEHSGSSTDRHDH